ncbi:hypothetical protein HB884_16935, partial [Listeria booriae]|uniref:YopX family protein n=1 Tax=Listeria booriae TaxID=1552123 RepID=UPI0017E5805F
FENQKDWHLMQYTGLRDKNGNKIFEGDIIEAKYGFERKTGQVAFIEGVFCMEVDKRGYSLIECDNREILGNIHDNPELLGGAAE